MGGIKASDIEGWIGFGIAKTLRIFQTGIEGEAFELHAGKNVIAGAV